MKAKTAVRRGQLFLEILFFSYGVELKVFAKQNMYSCYKENFKKIF